MFKEIRLVYQLKPPSAPGAGTPGDQALDNLENAGAALLNATTGILNGIAWAPSAGIRWLKDKWTGEPTAINGIVFSPVGSSPEDIQASHRNYYDALKAAWETEKSTLQPIYNDIKSELDALNKQNAQRLQQIARLQGQKDDLQRRITVVEKKYSSEMLAQYFLDKTAIKELEKNFRQALMNQQIAKMDYRDAQAARNAAGTDIAKKNAATLNMNDAIRRYNSATKAATDIPKKITAVQTKVIVDSSNFQEDNTGLSLGDLQSQLATLDGIKKFQETYTVNASQNLLNKLFAVNYIDANDVQFFTSSQYLLKDWIKVVKNSLFDPAEASMQKMQKEIDACISQRQLKGSAQ